jgi:hypothetical protein
MLSTFLKLTILILSLNYYSEGFNFNNLFDSMNIEEKCGQMTQITLVIIIFII